MRTHYGLIYHRVLARRTQLFALRAELHQIEMTTSSSINVSSLIDSNTRDSAVAISEGAVLPTFSLSFPSLLWVVEDFFQVSVLYLAKKRKLTDRSLGYRCPYCQRLARWSALWNKTRCKWRWIALKCMKSHLQQVHSWDTTCVVGFCICWLPHSFLTSCW